ncbi:MAG: non-canonical purine NTP pyrophosphatase [Candidatus Saccharimonadales bacterium]
MNIIFATGNQRKIQEATDVLAPLGITVNQQSVDTDEIQHSDPAEITKAKAKAAFAEVGVPVVVQDTSWSIPALGGFPGGYMKDISAWFVAEDWLALMSQHDDRTIQCHEHVAYYDGEQLQHFEAVYKGTMLHEARGRRDPSESFECVTVLYGDKTMAEQLADGDIASAGEELRHWVAFGEWYTAQQPA